MPYFSNSTMGDKWQARNCADCVHNQEDKLDHQSANTCQLLLAFEFGNYDQHHEGQDTLKTVFNILAPQLSEPPWNDECKMRISRKRIWPARRKTRWG